MIINLHILGSKIHARKRESNYGEPFKVGDVIGCYIKLNKNNPKENLIKFYKNGIDQGVAYEGSEIPSIGYYPAISIYNKAIVRVNFGPCFIENYNIEDVYSVSELQPLSHENKLVRNFTILLYFLFIHFFLFFSNKNKTLSI